MWKYASYIRKGLSHEAGGTDCQDRVIVCENRNCIVAVLADGLGSLEHSAVAADTATRTVAEFFLSMEQDRAWISTPEGAAELAEKLIAAAQMRIREKADQLGFPTETMDCTLGFVCVYKRENYAVIGRLGDSAVCVIRKGNSEVINDTSVSANGTSAVLDADAAQSLMIQVRDLDAEEIYGFLLSSDGLDGEVYMKSSRCVQKAAQLYFNAALREDAQQIIGQRVEELLAFEDTPFDDDISIAVLSRAEAELVFPEDATWLCSCGTRNRMHDSYCCNCDNDMVAVYENYRFRDYGGKDAFFLWMNQHPEEEKRILSRKPEPEPDQKHDDVPEQKPDDIPEQKPNDDPVQQPGDGADRTPKAEQETHCACRKQMIVAAAAGLLTGFLLGTLVGGIWWGNDRTEQDPGMQLTEPPAATAGTMETTAATEAVETTEATEPADAAELTEPAEITEPSEQEEPEPSEKVYQELPDGSVYWGAMEEGVPHGRGVLLKKGYYYLGQFSAGKMDGVFTIVSENGDSRISFVEFREDEVSWSEDGDLRRCSVLRSELTLCDRPGGEEICVLKKGDVVYRTETPESEIDEVIWVEVIWNNTVGWVPADTVG